MLTVDPYGLLSKGANPAWSDACGKGFTGLKDALCSAPVLLLLLLLLLPDLNKTFIIGDGTAGTYSSCWMCR